MSSDLVISAYGEAALIVTREHPDADQRWASMRDLSAAVRTQRLPGVENVIATFDTLTIEFDPLRTDVAGLQAWIHLNAPQGERVLGTGRIVRLPVVYGGEFGPDLTAVADELGISADEVISLHSGADWRVAFNGAPAGTPLHDGSPFSAPVRRMPEPRVRIPAGTIAVAGLQGTIYTVPAPGGWRLLGRTPVRVIDPTSEAFVAIQPGDTLRFDPLTPAEFAAAPTPFIGEVLA